MADVGVDNIDDVCVESEVTPLHPVKQAVTHHLPAFKKLTIMHIAAGVLAISLSITTAVLQGSDVTYNLFPFTSSAPGIWSGVGFLVCAALTFVALEQRTTTQVTVAWCGSASATLCACTMFTMELATCIIILSEKECCKTTKTSLVILHMAASLVACCELIMSTVTCGYCCRVYCCLPEPVRDKPVAMIYSIFRKASRTQTSQPSSSAHTSRDRQSTSSFGSDGISM